MESKIYAVRTTIGQERSVADMMTARIGREHFEVYSILVPHDIRGYVMAEALNKTEIEKSLRGVSHAKGIVEGEKARVVRVDVKKEEITVELFEATVPIPVTVKGDSIKVVRKEAENEAND